MSDNQQATSDNRPAVTATGGKRHVTYGVTVRCERCSRVVMQDPVHPGYPMPHKCTATTADKRSTRDDVRAVFEDIEAELSRAEKLHPNYPGPDNPVRRIGIIIEECGEAMARALDVTRHPSSPRPQKWVPAPEGGQYRREMTDAELKAEMYLELVETAATAVRALLAMRRESSSDER